MDQLSLERLDNRDSWRNFVFSCHDGGPQYYEACVRISLKSAKYTPYCVEELWDWCDQREGYRGPRVTIDANIGWAKKDKPGWVPSSGYKFEAIAFAEFSRKAYTNDYLVERCFVRGQPCVLGGPPKVLKTSVAMDLSTSLCTGTKFLNRFRVYRKVRTVFLSAESGEGPLQDTYLAVCKSKGIDPGSVEGMVGFTLPRLSNDTDMTELVRGLKEHAAEVVVIDPAYTSLDPAGKKVNTSIVYEMGPLLHGVCEPLQAAGITPILVFHTRKASYSNYDPMGLDELSGAGLSEFFRQWLMVKRQSRFVPGTGHHELWFSAGGSVGHSSEWSLTIEEGVCGEDVDIRKWKRGWEPKVEKVSAKAAEKRNKKAEKAAEQLESDVNAVLTHAINGGGRAGVSRMKGELKPISPGRVDKAIEELVTRGQIERGMVDVQIGGEGKQATRGVDGIILLSAPV